MPAVMLAMLLGRHANLANPLLRCTFCLFPPDSMFAPFDELLKEAFYEGLISVFIGRNAEPDAAC